MTRTTKLYSEVFKRQVVSEYEAGSSVADLKRKYGIKGTPTIPNWIRKYSKQGYREEAIYIQSADEINRIRELEKQIVELQQALGRITLEKLKLESILEVLQADEASVKKNDRPSSRVSSGKSGKTESE